MQIGHSCSLAIRIIEVMGGASFMLEIDNGQSIEQYGNLAILKFNQQNFSSEMSGYLVSTPAEGGV